MGKNNKKAFVMILHYTVNQIYSSIFKHKKDINKVSSKEYLKSKEYRVLSISIYFIERTEHLFTKLFRQKIPFLIQALEKLDIIIKK